MPCTEATVVALGRVRVFGTRAEWDTGDHSVIAGNRVRAHECSR